MHAPSVKPARPDEDLVLLFAAIAAATSDEVMRRVERAGHGDLRPSHGYVFQHLVPGPISITDLARRLGVSQQAASKQVADLEGRGLVRRRPDPDDGRGKLVALSPRGRKAVEAARTSRVAVLDEVTDALGGRSAATLVRLLGRLAAQTGADVELAGRRLRPEADR